MLVAGKTVSWQLLTPAQIAVSSLSDNLSLCTLNCTLRRDFRAAAHIRSLAIALPNFCFDRLHEGFSIVISSSNGKACRIVTVNCQQIGLVIVCT